jgi:hypothetical protein
MGAAQMRDCWGRGKMVVGIVSCLCNLPPAFIAKLLRAKKKKKKSSHVPKGEGEFGSSFPPRLGCTSTKMTFKQVAKPLNVKF